LDILNYTVTSNHIHLLVYDGQVNIIPDSIQLIAGRTGREYNQRKNRRGAFWEDRYHATAVESNTHLIRCMAYIDLNMVRAGVVRHPGKWKYGGYNAKLGAKAMGRRAVENSEGHELREAQNSYKPLFNPEKCSLRLKNAYFWQVSQ
jgi:putative transposase